MNILLFEIDKNEINSILKIKKEIIKINYKNRDRSFLLI